MRTFLFFSTLLLFVLIFNLNAKDQRRHKSGKSKTVKVDGPVKNIPPQVLQALKTEILSFDSYLNPTFATSTVIWSRYRNLFHVVVFHPCNDDEPLSYSFIADIEANGNIIYSRFLPIDCIKIPPDQP
jgi:UDP:flavonoid glycosyltransferase YjiC (YdhE family)